MQTSLFVVRLNIQMLTILYNMGGPQLTLIMLSVTPAVVIGAVVFGKFVKSVSKAQQDAQAEATDVAGFFFLTIRGFKNA